MTLRHLVLLSGLSVALFFTALGVPRLWDRDEPRNAGASRDMLRSGDWVVPRFNGELRTQKPVLINWLMASAFAVFEDPEFAARFWSAALGVGTVLMTYGIGRRLFNPSVGVWGGVVLASNLQFPFEARAATPEMLFAFFLTAATLVFVLGAFKPKVAAANGAAGTGAEPPAEPRITGSYFPSFWPAALMYAMMGMAVLAKGPAGFVLPAAVVGMFLLIMRLPARPGDPPASPRGWRRVTYALARPFTPAHVLRTAWSMRPITALLVVAVVALPWYVLVWQRTGGAWVKGFIWEHNIERAATPMEGHGGGLLVYPLMVLFYYPAAILIGFFPWSLLSVPIVTDFVRRVRWGPPWATGYVFLACWAGVYVVAFSIVRTKLPSYMTPMYPALALATGAFLYHWTHNLSVAPPKAVSDALGALAVSGGLMVIGLSVAAWAVLGGDVWLGCAGLGTLAGGWIAHRLASRGRYPASAMALATTAAAGVLAITGVTVRVDRYQHSYPVVAAILSRSDAPRVRTLDRQEPSWVFYTGQTLVPCRNTADAAAFLASGRDAFVITSDDKYGTLEKMLPPGIGIVCDTRYFPRRGRLLVIGHQDGERVTAGGTADQPDLAKTVRSDTRE